MTVSIDILGAPTRRLTMNDRPHWSTRHRLTKGWRGAAFRSAIAELGTAPSGRRQPAAWLQVVFHVSDPGRRRDPHNWAPTEKAIVDGLVDAGLWPDDTPEHVLVVPCEFHRATGPAAMCPPTVHIHPRSEGPPPCLAHA